MIDVHVTEERGETSPIRRYQAPSTGARASKPRSALTSISVMDDEVSIRAHWICKAAISLRLAALLLLLEPSRGECAGPTAEPGR